MYKTEAIILSVRKIGEADELINIYTKDFGKLLIKARSAKKITTRQGNFLHTPSIVYCNIVSTRAGYVLSGIKNTKEYPGISRDIFASGFVSSFLELSNSVLSDGQKDEKLWRLLVRVFEEASGAVGLPRLVSGETGKKGARHILWRMEKAWLLTLLAVLGLKPEKLKLGGIKSATALDVYIQRMLQDKFERRIYFFGLKTGLENKK